MKKYYYIIVLSLVTLLIAISIWEASIIHSKNITISELKNDLSNCQTSLAQERSEIKNLKDDLRIYKKEPHPIEIAVQECMKKENYTTAGMSMCVDNSINDWFKEINKYLKLLNEVLPPEMYKKVLTSQTKWLEYRKAQTDLINNTVSTRLGTIYINISSAMRASIVEDRAYELKHIYDDMKEEFDIKQEYYNKQ